MTKISKNVRKSNRVAFIYNGKVRYVKIDKVGTSNKGNRYLIGTDLNGTTTKTYSFDKMRELSRCYVR